MSAEDVELVRRRFDGLRVGEVSPELCHREIEIRKWAESPSPGPYHGHPGLRRWWEDTQDSFEEMHFELDELLGDCLELVPGALPSLPDRPNRVPPVRRRFLGDN